MVEDVAHIDFETRTGAGEIGKIGAHKYSEHPSTEVMCLGIGWNDEPAKVMGVALRASRFDPKIHATHAEWLRLLEHVQRGGLCVAHNAPFELAIWNNVGVSRYGWPVLKPAQMDCTMARAYSMSLPGKLENARAAVGLLVEKDMTGHRLMVKMSKPKTREICAGCQGHGICTDVSGTCDWCGGVGEIFTWHDDPEQIDKLFSYCRTDIEVERALDKRLVKLSLNEKRIWQLDYEINNRGIMVDVENVVTAQKIVELETDRLDEEMRQATSGQVATCTAHVQLKKWIVGLGVETEGVAKDDVNILLSKSDLPDAVRAALSLRQEAAKSSTAKLISMLNRAGAEQRLRGMFQYYGANTGRWAARGVQLHNLPRPKLKQEDIEKTFEAFEKVPLHDVPIWMSCFLGQPMSIVSDCLRGFLRAAEGRHLFAIDFSSIESRVLAWIAGEIAKLDVFRTHGKIYEYVAALIYRVSYVDISKEDPRRQVGKAGELGLGFQGGVGALQKICKSNGIKLEPVLEGLWQLADQRTKDMALSRYKAECTKALKKAEKAGEVIKGWPLGITKKEWLASELVKVSWRKNNPAIVRFWEKIEHAAIMAVMNPGEVYSVNEPEDELPEIYYVVKGSFLICKLPSGRRIYYPYPRVEERTTDWGAKKPTLTYKYEDANTRKWVRGPTYGGSLTENVVQGIARDLLANRMLAVSEEGHRIVLHVHDELVTESSTDKPKENFAELKHIVETVPAWASGLPIAAEGWYGRRYRK